jgi:hypothetical protein
MCQKIQWKIHYARVVSFPPTIAIFPLKKINSNFEIIKIKIKSQNPKPTLIPK